MATTLPRLLLPAVILVVLAAPVWTDDAVDEDSLFGGTVVDEADPGSGDSDADISTSAVGDLLTGDAATVGGAIDFSVKLNTDPEELNGRDDIAASYILSPTVFIDARPDADFRVFLKTEIDYSGPSVGDTKISLTELFSDVAIADWLYLRAGKQNITWGSGYFFKPADLLSLEKVDPQDPESEPEGPVAARVHLPYRTNNFYAYTTLSDLPTGGKGGFAAKAEFVAVDSEFTLGGFYKRDSVSGAMATYAGSVGDLQLFAEVVAQYGSTITYVEDDGDVLATNKRTDTWFPSATAGFRYSWSDDEGYVDIRLAGQYYFNGEGYADSDILGDARMALLIAAGELLPSDFDGTGRHYGAGSVRWSDAFGSDLSLGGFWVGNMSDGSGRVSADLTWRINDYIAVTPGYSFIYGADHDEFSRFGAGHSIAIGFSLGTGAF